jgi:antirestriction protein ArdC
MDSSTAGTKLDLYELVTNHIIASLEKGVIPWQRPWAETGVPMNLLSKRHYRGINLWLLLLLNYERNFFLTWDQIKNVGGSVNRDEKGHIIVYWQQIQKKHAEERNGTKEQYVPMLRYYKVFNIAQCRDIPEHLIPKADATIKEFIPKMECESIIQGMSEAPPIEHKEQRAYYNIATDVINMPKKKSFKSVDSYYSTLFHELVHSTGAEKRLSRKTLTDMVPFGAPSYAMEELVAEMGSAYLCRFAGILPNEIENTVAYLDNWLGVFKKDKRFLITAAGQAQRAVDMILNSKEEGSKDEVDEPKEASVVS